ncbi:vWA domain-containing protein [Lacrimispora sp.]|uniref:vWA domain-containing protein n=1 Tax=Lacrimispora sp. TaxID=2719234 RepID=UPI002859F0ED|nr:VWA domain-containing protein [Lacrimispora sp.]MDR7810514.1 VWA domain-containing protein [Lacrimispora sp.]
MKIWRKIFLATGMIILLFTVRQITSIAGESHGFNENESEVVFLLDTSGSMNTYDKKRLAIDAIRQAAYSLPSNYKAGLVSYNTGIQTIAPVGAGLEQMNAQIEAITYKGYTNAGEGLNQAVGLFSDRESVDRSIVMLTDGEIDMPNQQAKESSRILYSDAMKRAKEAGVKIYIIAVGSELNDPQMHIFAGAEMTDGVIYWQGQSGTLVQIMNRILYERMNIPKKSVGVTDGNGGSLHVELPSPGAEHVRIMLTASQGIQNVTADYAAEEGHITSGENFAVLDMTRPAVEAVEVHFQTSDLTEVEAYMTVEYTAETVTEVSYRREASEAGEEHNGRTKALLADKQYADLKIWLKDIKGKNGNLWNTPYYDGHEVSFRVNGVTETGKISNGIIPYSLSIDGIDELSIEIDPGSFEEHYEITQPAFIKLAPPQEPILEPDYRPLWIILGVLAAALILILALWVKKKNTTVVYVAQPPASREPAKKMETKTCSYSGKFNIYVVRTTDGRDVPPQTYQLFGRNSGRMTLDQILSACKIKLGKIGEEDIIIYPGPDNSVIIMDQSERCTVLRGMEILKKGMGYPVFYNEKITITFEDESTEMEIHYKNLKPSERKA